MSNVKIQLLPLPDTPIPALVARIALEEEYRLAVASLSALAVGTIHTVWFALTRHVEVRFGAAFTRLGTISSHA
jgi:hypothetical protein